MGRLFVADIPDKQIGKNRKILQNMQLVNRGFWLWGAGVHAGDNGVGKIPEAGNFLADFMEGELLEHQAAHGVLGAATCCSRLYTPIYIGEINGHDNTAQVVQK